jgi:16S rRNA (guanine527-N7)-methyltransferase
MKPGEARTLTVEALRLGVELDPQSADRLERYVDLLELWNRRIHLTGERTRGVLIAKHLVDCMAPVPHLPPQGLVIDVGSGGGFPGIVLGCLRPDLHLVLLEPRRRRISFLREVIRSVPLPHATALPIRAEEAARDPELARRASLVIARGIALDEFLPIATPLLLTEGVAIAMQTPRAANSAAASAPPPGLRFVARHDYTVSGSARRSLLVFSMAPKVP